MTTRTLRYGLSWLTGRNPVREREITVDRGDLAVPASLFVPARGRPPFPAWVILHGMTRSGRSHPHLLRFVRAVAASRAVVVVPEVPEWIDLDLAPATTGPTVEGALRALRKLPEVGEAPVGLIGFSFGSPQALIASTRDELSRELSRVVGFGGYCDLERTVRFQFTGCHEWRGEELHRRPDPYGRWIVGANYLPRVPGFEEATDVAGALRRLARAAGDSQVPAWDAGLDALKSELREEVAPARRELFDLFAPPAHRRPDPERVEAMVEGICKAARRHEPLMEPGPLLDRVTCPVHLLHGHGDHLIPFSETLRLSARLPGRTPVDTTITRLFSHSKGDTVPSLRRRARETVRFVRALSRILDGG